MAIVNPDAGYQDLGNVLAGGNVANTALREAQGEQLGANTQRAIAEANAQFAKNKALANLPATMSNLFDDPKVAAGMAGAGQAGIPLEQLQQARLGNQKQVNLATVTDAGRSDDARAAALVAADPASHGIISPTAGGEAATNALHPSQGVTTTPLGQALLPAKVGLIQAQTNLANAGGNLKNTEAANNPHVGAAVGPGGLPKPPPGYQYVTDKTSGAVVPDDDGNPKLTPITGGPKDPNAPGAMGSREASIFSRALNAGALGTKALTNVANGTIGQSTGIAGVGSAPGHSAMASTVDSLRNALSPEEVQQYNTINTGLARNLAQIESSGMVTPGAFTDQIGAGTTMRAGDTEQTKLLRLAESRQIIETGFTTMLSNPRIPASQKQYIRDNLAQVQQAIPYSVEDVQNLTKAPPGTSMQDVISARGLRPAGAAPAPSAAAAPQPGATPAPSAAAAPPSGGQQVTIQQVHDYAVKHGLTDQAAAQHVQANGFKITPQ